MFDLYVILIPFFKGITTIVQSSMFFWVLMQIFKAYIHTYILYTYTYTHTYTYTLYAYIYTIMISKEGDILFMSTKVQIQSMEHA